MGRELVVGSYLLVEVDTCIPGKSSVRIDMPNGTSQHTTRYHDGRIGYDFPERIPHYVKAKVARFYEEVAQ